MKLISLTLIFFIKIYKYLISPLLGQNCRFLPTCSEYAEESLKTHGLIKGLSLTFKRISKCHPIKLLGGSSGLDFVPKKKCRKENINGS